MSRARSFSLGVCSAVALAATLGTGNVAGQAAGHRVLRVGTFDGIPGTYTTIQAAVNAVTTQQISNQFGTQRYALLFKPGVYGTAQNPLIINVGFYTDVAGLGAQPSDVTINGHVDVYNQCFSANNCICRWCDSDRQ